MATEMERLVVSLEARTKAFENSLNKANATAQKRLRGIETRFASANKNISSQFTALGGTVAKAFAIAGGLRGAQQLLDSSTRITNALKVSGLEGDKLSAVYERLFQSAQKNAAPLESLVTLYGRVAGAQGDLGVSTEQILGLTESVAQSIRLTGGSASEASGALLQLGQSLGSGRVQAEEYNSLLDGLRPLLQAAAAGIKQAGGSVSELTRLVKAGEISSKALFDGIEAGSGVLEQKLAGATFTASQGLERVYNSLIDAARKFDETTDASTQLGGALDGLATFISNVNFDNVIDEISRYINAAGDAIAQTQNLARAIGQALGLDAVGELMVNNSVANAVGITSERALGHRMSGEVPAADAVIQDWAARNYGPSVTTETTGRLPTAPAITPIDITAAKYRPPASAGGGGGSGGGGKGRKGRQDDLAREIEQIRERTTALQAETAAQTGINPLIDDYDFAMTKAKSTQELLTAAQKAGIEVTPELRAKIDALAEGYANATAEANKLAESQDRARETAAEFSDLGKDVLGGFIQDLVDGKSASEALSNALGKVADKLLDIALNSLFDGKGGMGGIAGFLGSIFGFEKGGVAAHGRPVPLRKFARGGVAKTASIFGEAGPEAAVPLPDGRRIPVDLRGPAASGGQQAVHVTVGVGADNNGNLLPFVESVSQKTVQNAAPSIVGASTKAVQRQLPGMLANAQMRTG